MSSPNDVLSLYRQVMDTVIRDLRPLFITQGLDEHVLDDLHTEWERRVHDFFAKTVARLSQQQAIQQAQQQKVMLQQQGVTATRNEESGESKQHTGQAGTLFEKLLHDANSSSMASSAATITALSSSKDKDKWKEKKLKNAATEKPDSNEELLGSSLDDDSDFSSNNNNKEEGKKDDTHVDGIDTDSLSSSSEGNNDGSSEHEQPNLILCLYEKVARTRNRYRTIMRHGIMHIGGLDYAFNRMTADFDF